VRGEVPFVGGITRIGLFLKVLSPPNPPVRDLEGDASADLGAYADETSDRYAAMVDHIRQAMGLTTLRYQRLDDMVAAIGLPREHLCTYCWNGQAPHE
jgi:amidophosphoribosyltransferase